jgi:hypothetical protein
VDGYGIDTFLLHTVACLGKPASIRLATTKQHAPSFPHLPAIFDHAVPVLLHPSTATAPTVDEERLRTVADREGPSALRWRPGALSRCGVEGIVPLWQDHAVDMGEHG